MYIEIFRSGTHTDGNGITDEYNPAKLDRIAVNYRNRILENSKNQAPVVIGHPDDNAPAYGWVKQIFRRGNSLIAEIDVTDNELIESLNTGKFRNVSIAIDSNLNFIHLGFLGAVNPAVEGLNTVRYSAVSNFTSLDSNLILLDNFEDTNNDKISELEQLNHEFCKKITEYESKFAELEIESLIRNLKQNDLFENDEINQKAKEILSFAQKLDKLNSNQYNAIETVMDFFNKITDQSTAKHHSSILNNTGIQSNISQDILTDRSLMHIKALDLLNSNPQLSYEDALNLSSSDIF